MVELAVVSDTHVPSRASSIPEWVRDRIRRADRTVHAGDFTSRETYEQCLELAGGDLTAVAGNMDPGIGDLPGVATLSVGGVTFVVTHGTGSPAGYEDRVVDAVRSTGGDVGIAGHTHEPLDTTHRGVRILNPGSATGAAPATTTSMMTVTVEDGSIDVTIEER